MLQVIVLEVTYFPFSAIDQNANISDIFRHEGSSAHASRDLLIFVDGAYFPCFEIGQITNTKDNLQDNMIIIL